MRITRLELHGFKSFPDRTTFHFGEGISCVVGPNGSGKSNVVDALKWCVGEQSARSLRGSEMTDVIFAGSADRKPVGYAEVALTLRASPDQAFPGEYSQLHELQVGRRLHRTGASEYFVNHTRVRRRDVVELLLDSGIGNNLYSFIEQGQVDKMITASPSERRSLIDEAAGIARYKARRDEAQQRLVTTSTQLDRAADVLDEMHRRLRLLERQVLVAARFRRWRALIRQGEIFLALVKHHALSQERRALRRELEELRAKEEGHRREVLRREEDLVERREELAVCEALVSTRRDELAELDARTRELDAAATLHERRAAELREEAERASLEVRRQAGLEAGAEAERLAAEGEVAALATSAAEVQARADRSREEHRVALEEWRVAREVLGEANAALESAVADRSRARSVLAVAESTCDAREAALQRATADRGSAEREALEAGRQVDRALASAREVEARLPPLEAAEAEADAELAEARSAEAAAVERRAGAEAARDAALRERTQRERERERAVERGRRWVEALRADRSERWARSEREASAAVAAQEARRVEARRRARSEREAAAKTRKEQVRAGGQARVEAAAARSREAAARLSAAERAEGEATRAQGAASGRLEAARSSLTAARRRLAAPEGESALLREVLGEPSSLLSELPPDRREEAVRRLGEDAGRAVVRDRALLAELLRRADRPVAVWTWSDGAPAPQDRVRWVESLEAALDHPGPSAGPGFRSDGAGGLRLGPPAALAEVVEAERRALAALAEAEAGVETATARAGAAREAREQAAASLEAAREEERSARAAADEGLRRVQAELEAERDAEEARWREEDAADLAALRATLAEERSRADALRAQGVGEAERLLEGFLAEAVEEVAIPDPSGAREEADRAGERVRALTGVRDRRREDRQREASALSEAGLRLAACRAALDRTTLAAGAAERAVEQANTELAEARRAKVEGAEQEARASTAEAAARAGAAAAQVAVNGAAEAERAVSERLGRAEVERVALEERTVAARRRVAEAARRVEAAGEGAGVARAQVERALAAAAEAAASGEGARSLASSTRGERAGRWDELERLKERASALAEGVAGAEKALRGHRQRLEEVGREAEQAAARVTAAQQELEVLRRALEDRYQVSPAAWLDRLHARGTLAVEADPDAAEGIRLASEEVPGVPALTVTTPDLADQGKVVQLVEELELWRSSLAELGEVHLGAAAEHRELRGRVDELETQRADLEHGLEQIRGAIARLNRECRERFRETFDVVNDHFRESYPRLVGGGSARLALTDDEDLLETGVDIYVQPPGKRLQNLQLLSGGEKAMTAIALLIALFKVKPSPFCVLDEVDAPLDEANGTRFNDMLREMARRSQFLVVTHNRKTMECADTLYGITMARPGVSRLVSVQLPAS